MKMAEQITLEPFIPILNTGKILHISKDTNFGLGKEALSNLKHF